MATPPLYQLFADQVIANPEVLALDGPGGAYTYQQLGQWSDLLCEELRQRGGEPGQLVGVCLERTPARVAAMLAVLRLGAACVPLDPRHPTDRLHSLLVDIDCRLVLTEPGQAHRFAPPLLPLPVAAQWSPGQPALAGELPVPGHPVRTPVGPPGRAQPADLAYVFYTSGSTGRPKAVALTHRNLLNLVRATDFLALQPGDRVGQCVTPIFDLTNVETWAALPRGATLVVIPRPAVPDLDELLELLQQYRVETVVLATGVFRMIAARGPHRLAGVRQLLIGGEAADPPSFAAVRQESKPEQLVNVYGPTETTSFVTTFTLPPEWDGRSIPIGAPIDRTELRVLDSQLRPVPPGTEGELYIGGESVARGYLGAPGLTAERFIPDPAPPPGEPGRRLYRTGDLGHCTPNGEFVYHGRRDGQVKLRGIRVELAEVEAAMVGEAGVAAAATAVWEPAAGDRRLVGCVIGEPGLDLEKLRQSLRAQLPDFMVPARLVQADSLPLTGNGKVDRAGVVQLAVAAPEPAPAVEATPAGDDLTGLVAAAWAETLHRQVGLDDNFFDSGGDSLLLLELHARVEQQLGREIPLMDLVEFPTIAGLAEQLSAPPDGPA